MRAIIAFLLLVAFSPGASAKCAVQLFLVTGVALDSDGAPVSGALVGASWIDHSVPGGPAMSLTDRNGKYSIPIWFDTYSGHSLLWGDECDETLSQVSVSAYTSTEYSLPLLVPISNAQQVTVPALKIEYPIRREPIW